jgi:hypothetical protein
MGAQPLTSREKTHANRKKNYNIYKNLLISDTPSKMCKPNNPEPQEAMSTLR